MSDFYTAFTPIGRAKMMTSTLHSPLKIKEMAVGFDVENTVYTSADDFPTSFLAYEKWRGGIGNDEINAVNPTWREITATVPGEVGGFKINRLALFDEAGEMIVFGLIPLSEKPLPIQGIIKPLSITAIIAWENADMGTVKINLDINQTKIAHLTNLVNDMLQHMTALTKKVDQCCLNNSGNNSSDIAGTQFEIIEGDLNYTTDGNFEPLEGVTFSLFEGDLIATGDSLPLLTINESTGELEITE